MYRYRITSKDVITKEYLYWPLVLRCQPPYLMTNRKACGFGAVWSFPITTL
nr:MAG TPA: hypothetical protein [Caudoviricetes sp.]